MPYVVRAVFLVVAGLLLGACGSYVQTQVTAFHALPPGVAGKKFIMVPYKDQRDSLEWRSYSEMVARKLESKGLIRSDQLSGADLAVFMAYAIDGGRTSVSSVPMYGQTGGGTTTTTTGYVGYTPVYGSTYTPPTYGITGYAPVESTVYGRTLKITILDVPASYTQKKGVPVYEATATSAGSKGTLNLVMPAIVDGVFKDWPGPSGATRTVTASVNER